MNEYLDWWCRCLTFKEKRALRKKKKEEEKRNKADMALLENDKLRDLVPSRGLEFYSDYTKIKDGIGSKGNSYRSILRLFVNTNAMRGLNLAWGTGLFTVNLKLPNGVETELIQSTERMSEKILNDKMEKSERSVNDQLSDSSAKSNKEKANVSNLQLDLQQIAIDLANSDKYHNVVYKLVVNAPTLAKLDEAIDTINRQFAIRFKDALKWLPFEGEQDKENSRLFDPVWTLSGSPLGFTSSELSGAYNLVSHGISDLHGEYVGTTVGDLVDNAVIFDVDNYRDHVIIGSDNAAVLPREESVPINTRASAVWGKKLTQAALMNGHSVVSLVLDNTDLRKIGSDDSAYTTYIEANHGAINPFELFGSIDDPIAAFTSHTETLTQMVLQLDPDLKAYDTGQLLRKTLTEFYVSQGLWIPNASARLDELKAIGRPHDNYPTLRLFMAYLREALDDAKRMNDVQDIEGLSRLVGAFGKMLASDDLFDIQTDPLVDAVDSSANVVYDFSSLTERDVKLAMAQLINTFNFATKKLGLQKGNQTGSGDVLMIYGADELFLKNPVFVEFLQNKIRNLQRKNVRVVWLYNDTEIMLNQAKLNNFESADYILTGNLSNKRSKQFEKALGKELLPSFLNSMSQMGDSIFMLHRGDVNMFFRYQLMLQANSGIGVDILDKERV